MRRNKDFEAILEEIKASLTGDREKDISYLQEQFKKYNHDRVIRDTIERMISTLIEEKENLDRLKDFKKQLSFNKTMSSAISSMREGLYEEALSILVEKEPLIRIILDTYHDDSIHMYRYFEDPYQALTFSYHMKEEKEMRTLLSFPYNLGGYFYLLGLAKLRCGKKKEARLDIEEALRINPTSFLYYLALSECSEDSYEKDEIIKSSYSYIHEGDSLSEFYLYFAKRKMEGEKYDEARSLILGSLLYSSSDQERDRITSFLNDLNDKQPNPRKMEPKEAMRMFEDSSLPIGGDKELVQFFVEAGNKEEEEGNLKMAYEIYGRAFEISKSESLAKKINEISSNIESIEQ